MYKYEIMLMLNPKTDDKEAFEFVNDIFKNTNVKKSEKLELTDLAYPIKKSTKAHYFLFEVEAEGSLIGEFTRRANINKNIWRFLVINLDTEKGLNKPRKQCPGRKPYIRKDNRNNKFSSYNRRDSKDEKDNNESKNYKNEDKKTSRRPYTRRTAEDKNSQTKKTEE